MDASATGDFVRLFSELPDPRRSNRRYLLGDILLLAVSAIMCGCDTWQDIEDWTADAFEFLSPLMQKPEHGTPSADTFRRVFTRLCPDGFERCFIAWTAALHQSSGGKLIGIDGKTLRQSFQHAWDKTPVHMVSAYASENRLILGQLKVAGKENEILAIPKLLELLNLKGCTVSIDAIACQKAIAKQITEAGADYLLAVKENQPTLHGQVKKLLDEAILEKFKDLSHDYHEQTNAGHGRIETRRVWVTDEVKWLKVAADWPGLRQVAVVECRREDRGKLSIERRYFIASHPELNARRTAEAIRGHWGIENQVHWVLDVGFGEDQSRIRKGNGPENFSRLRRIVLNKLQAFQDPSGKKHSLRIKRKKCGWRFDYFLLALIS